MRIKAIAETFLLAALGGILFFLLHIPLAWMLGPLTAVVIWTHVFTKSVYWPIKLRDGALIFLGYVIGSAFTANAARQIVAQLPVMLIVTLVILGMSLLLGYVTHRQTGITLSTSLMGSVPGGFSQMVLMSEEIDDADVSVVSFMHTVRLLSVVFVVPYLATQASGIGSPSSSANRVADFGLFFTPIPDAALLILCVTLATALLAYRLRWPTPFLLGSITGTALIAMTGIPCPPLPPWLTIASQIAVGAYMGSGILLANLANWRSLLTYTLLGVAFVLAASLATGYLLSSYYGYSNVTSFLSMAPGGIAEMSVTGIALQADLSVIASYQIFRLFFMMMLTPLMFRYWLKN